MRNVWEANTSVEFEKPEPVELTLDHCIKCNICVTTCPVTAVTDLFPGPKYEAPQAGRFRQPKQPTPDYSVDYCSGCRACNLACPTGVKIAEINARARNHIVEEGKQSGRNKLRNNLIARPELLGKFGQPVAPLANFLLHGGIGRFFANKLFGFATKAPMPVFSRERFSNWLKKRSAPANATRKIVYFRGCSTEYFEPRVGKAAVQVLEANGFEVLVPEQNCCGLPLLSNGEFDAARAYHGSNIEKLVGYVKQGYVIVGTSTSCTLTLKEEAPELLDYFTEDARLLAANTYDIDEFLTMLVRRGRAENGRAAADSAAVGVPHALPVQGSPHWPSQRGNHGADSGAGSGGKPGVVLRCGRDVRLQGRKVPDCHGCGTAVVRLHPRGQRPDQRVRQRNVPLANHRRHRAGVRASHRAALLCLRLPARRRTGQSAAPPELEEKTRMARMDE
jgi:Fe-S oxidoreductase